MEFNKKNPVSRTKENHVQRGSDVPIIRDILVLQVDACCFDEGFVTFGCVFKDHDKKIVIASTS